MFNEMTMQEVTRNPITDFGRDWMLLTAGCSERGYNTMTVAWGHLGSLWNSTARPGAMPTAVCYIRPSRYTKEFVDRESYFTLSHFDDKYKAALSCLGSHSGRDTDKVAAAGLTPLFDDDLTYFDEADFVYVCRKLYHAPLLPEGFVDKSLIDINYPQRDFHEVYIGEIERVLARSYPSSSMS